MLAAAARTQISMAEQLLVTAQQNLQASDFAAPVLIEHVRQSRHHAAIALVQLAALIKRMPSDNVESLVTHCKLAVSAAENERDRAIADLETLKQKVEELKRGNYPGGE